MSQFGLVHIELVITRPAGRVRFLQGYRWAFWTWPDPTPSLSWTEEIINERTVKQECERLCKQYLIQWKLSWTDADHLTVPRLMHTWKENQKKVSACRCYVNNVSWLTAAVFFLFYLAYHVYKCKLRTGSVGRSLDFYDFVQLIHHIQLTSIVTPLKGMS